jgi:hypothetical protein
MTRERRRRIVILVGCLAVTLGMIQGYRKIGYKNQMDKVQTMTQQMKTVCVGRILIDVPIDAPVSFREASVAGVVFGAYPDSPEGTLQSRILEIHELTTGSMNDLALPSLEKQIDVNAVNLKATVMYYDRKKPTRWFESGKEVSSGEQAITVQAYAWKDNVLYHFKAVDLASPKFDRNVEELIKRFESLPDDAIPSASGFCAGRALVHDPISADDHEQITAFIGLKGFPDVAIRLDTAVQPTPTTSLLERDANNPARATNPQGIATLRKGARALNGIDGEEVIVRTKEENGTSGHFAMWASHNKVGDVMAPAITLEIETGTGNADKRVNASLSDEALMQIWDKVSASLRIRPTTATQNDKLHAVAKQPLGAMGATGSVCLQTGYWDCSERGNIVGGHRQLFKAGQRFPQALVSSKLSIWQKLTGDQPTYRTDTEWTLAQYVEDLDAQG